MWFWKSVLVVGVPKLDNKVQIQRARTGDVGMQRASLNSHFCFMTVRQRERFEAGGLPKAQRCGSECAFDKRWKQVE